jgi:hypothetical protein
MKNLKLLEKTSRTSVAILAAIAFAFGLSFKVEGLPFGRTPGA